MKKTAVLTSLYALLITLISTFIITLIWNVAKYDEYKVSWGTGLHLSVIVAIVFFLLSLKNRK